MPIEILGNGIKVLELLIPRKDLADFFKIITEDERETTFIQALEIGIYCLERAKISHEQCGSEYDIYNKKMLAKAGNN